MLDSFLRLLGRRPGERDHGDVGEWARSRGFGFKRARGEAGFVIDGQHGGKPWRIEWGAPQRDYIVGHELRLRMELELPSDAQMLLLSRPLMDALERKTFEEFTDNVQTQIGTKTPEEMRWLVMFPKVNMATLKSLRGPFGAVASHADTGLAWLSGPLADALDHPDSATLRDGRPFVLMTLRGRAYLRLQLEAPRAGDIGAALAVFEAGVAQALKIATASSAKPRDWPSHSDTTAWQTMQPDDGGAAPGGSDKRR